MILTGRCGAPPFFANCKTGTAIVAGMSFVTHFPRFFSGKRLRAFVLRLYSAGISNQGQRLLKSPGRNLGTLVLPASMEDIQWL